MLERDTLHLTGEEMESCGYNHLCTGRLGLAQNAAWNTSLGFGLMQQEDWGYGDTGEP